MCFRKFTKSVLFCVTLILFGSILAAAQAGSSIAGDVVDINGAAIPGARVTAIDPKTNLQQVVETNTNGFFIFQLNPGIYTIRVEKDGFKTKEKTRVVLNSLERINAGEFVLETGTVSEVVTVEADQAQLQLQTESGERSNVITNDQLKDLAINGRNTLDLLVTIPGFSGDSNSGAAAGADQKISGPQSVLLGFSINGSRQGQSNFTVDGATNIDVGDNGATVVTVNPDAVAEVKVLTSNYQAEFGRAGGAQISIVTRGGGNQFRGGARYFRRHDSLNANNFFSNASNPYIPRPLYRYNYYGYDISGPIYLPRFGEGGSPYWSGKDRLFFYWNQEFYDQSRIPAGISRLRVPTAAERAGNFSQTTDGNGNKIYIRDPLKSGTCSATNQEACFPGNIIPADRFYANGTNILNQYPLPNLEGNPQYNYVFQDFNRYPRREDILRIDFKVNEANRLSGRFINNYDEQIRPFGGSFVAPQNLPITYISQIQPGQTASLSLESNMMGSTLFNEFTIAFSRMKISIDAEDPEKLTPGGTGINIPWLYPNSSISGYIPSFAYGGIINQGFPSNSLNPLPFAPNRRLFNISDKITKVVGNHTIKGGIFIQDSVNNRSPQVNNNGSINFANNPANILNTQHPYSNALLGVYNSYSQANNYPFHSYRFKNIEGFIQDTWRVRRNLSFDYGIRLSNYQPQYITDRRGNTFFLDRWDPAKAPRLYTPVCLAPTASAACTTANRRGVDPNLLVAGFTPTAANTVAASLIGAFVPGSGDPFNGMWSERDGAPRGGFNSPAILIAPRIGFAWEVMKETVLRGGFGMSYDRLSGNVIFAQGDNPPGVVTTTLSDGYLANITADSASFGVNSRITTPQNVVGYAQEGDVPVIYSFSLGVQRKIGAGMVIDIAYVGSMGRHLSQRRNINAVPYLTTFQSSAQDPTRYANSVIPTVEPNRPQVYADQNLNFTGQFALPALLLRPYRGYGAITMNEFVGTSNYNSLQVSVNRRLSKDFRLGASYTFSKTLTTASGDTAGTHPFDTRAYNYGLASYDRPHVFSVNYNYNIPSLTRWIGKNALTKLFFDNYQLSGISRFQSGTPYTVGLSIPNIDTATRFTGSPDLGANFYLRGDPNGANESLLINPDAFLIPKPGEIGPFPFFYLRNPSYWNHDITLAKNFYFSEKRNRYFQIRFEFFNFLNDTRFINVNTAATVETATGSTDLANFYNFTVNPTTRGTSVLPIGQFFGEPNGARAARVIQLGAKLYF